jgi:hypothetical protein
MMTFLDELLLEVEEKEKKEKLELDRVRADQLLMVLEGIDAQTDEITKTADAEIQLIESWKASELSRIDKKRSFIVWQLEEYAKALGEKTVRLPHGVLKLRQGRDKVDVVDIDRFMPAATRNNLLRTCPEHSEPDLNAILAYIKQTKRVPPGVELIPGTQKFTYLLTERKPSNGEEQRESPEN